MGQCGNGARCLGHFIHHHQISSHTTLKLSTQTTEMQVTRITDNQYQVKMPEPNFKPEALPSLLQGRPPYCINYDDKTWSCFIANVGNPHTMILQESLDSTPSDTICQSLSELACFPEGVNLSFATLIDPSTLQLKVYERGSGWTAACGSAATACACMVMRHAHGEETIHVQQAGGTLKIHWPQQSGPVLMSGPSEICFEGHISL